MAQIALWLKQLIAALFLVGFLEMIIPDNEMKGVTKIVMGLMIIMILIQPLTSIFKISSNVIWSLSTHRETNLNLPSTEQILKQGLEIKDSWMLSMKKNNQQILESKIKNIIGMIDEISLCKLTVDYDGVNLKKASLVIKAEEPLDQTNGFKEKVNRKIFNSLELIAGLPSKQVEVIWE